MKTRIFAVLSILVLVTLACGSSTTATPEKIDPVTATIAALDQEATAQAGKEPVRPVATATTEPIATIETPSIYKIGETAVLSNIEVVVLSVTEIIIDNYQPDAGNRFVQFDFEMKNTGDTDAFVMSGEFKLLGPDGTQYDADITAAVMSDRVKSFADSLLPGAKIAGGQIYQIPIEAKGFRYIYKPAISFDDKMIEFDPGF